MTSRDVTLSRGSNSTHSEPHFHVTFIRSVKCPDAMEMLASRVLCGRCFQPLSKSCSFFKSMTNSCQTCPPMRTGLVSVRRPMLKFRTNSPEHLFSSLRKDGFWLLHNPNNCFFGWHIFTCSLIGSNIRMPYSLRPKPCVLSGFA